MVYVEDVLIISHDVNVHAVKNLKLLLHEEGRNMKTTAKSPFPSSTYSPETDTSEECDDAGSSRYSQLIGVLRWAVELGRIDIYTKTALLSQHLALPRVGHLEIVYHVFVYLSKHKKSSMINFFDPTDPLPLTPTMVKPDWTEFYLDAEEELLP